MAHAVSSVVAHSPWVLAADFSLCSDGGTLRCNVVVCHCPHNQSALEERVVFYDVRGKLLRANQVADQFCWAISTLWEKLAPHASVPTVRSVRTPTDPSCVRSQQTVLPNACGVID